MIDNGLRDARRLIFQMVVFRGIAQTQHRRRGAGSALLHCVRELVCQQVPPWSGVRIVLAGIEDDVLPDRVGMRIDSPRGIRRSRIGVNANAAEISSESWFHEGSRRSIQRTSG